MIQHILRSQYGVLATNEFRLGNYDACQDDSNVYLLVPLPSPNEEAINELAQLTQFLTQRGDSSVFALLPSSEQRNIIRWEEGTYCVLTKEIREEKLLRRVGRKLAKFHGRGREVPFQVRNMNIMGQWRSFWIQRLEQMEMVWNSRLFQAPENEFDRMFMESFPYYMGMAENAIQYLVDTEMDDEPMPIDSGTVCHQQFTYQTWNEKKSYKNPFDWVFDHASRDLAEWTRSLYFRNIKTYEPEMIAFYQDYRSISNLSSFSWRLLYARLLFPLHYFEAIEEYYITSSEMEKHLQEERLQKLLLQCREYENLLRNFYSMVGAPVKRMKIPRIEWLV